MNRFAVLFTLLLASGLAADAELRDVKTLRRPDGAEMPYVDAGSGEPALVFIHCGNCRMEIWSETLEAFAPERRVVAMDLPGYGRSTTGSREHFTIETYGADVAALADHLGLERVVLVGNSLGGPIALEAARILGTKRVLGVVAVDTLHDVERTWPEEAWREQLEAYRNDFVASCNQLMLGLLPENAPSAVKARIEHDTCGGDPQAALALFETLLEYDQAAAIHAAEVPIRAINSTKYPTSVDVNRRHAASFDVILMDGVGHYPQVERPKEFQGHLRDVVGALQSPAE